MKQLLFLFFVGLLYSFQVCAQANCSAPLHVAICPDVYLSNQTNAGMLDDAPASFNIAGEDLVYEISVPSGARKIFASVVKASAPMHLSLQTTTCGGGASNSITTPAGDTNVVFSVANSTLYYLWVDAAGTVTFDLSLGADTDSVFVSNANTQGNLQIDSSGCEVPVFLSSKPFFEVSYNGISKTSPLTMSPLSVTGTMCISAFFKNTTGIEAIKTFTFNFPATGFSSATTVASVPGVYNAGNWIASQSGTVWTLTFHDSAGLGKGDFTGTPNTCLKYKFCFDVIPISNDPTKTVVSMTASSDGFGAAFSGYIGSGCCPSPYANCFGSGGSASGGHSFSFSFNDPAAGLPVEWIDFKVNSLKDYVRIEWTTASEINNDYFTVQKSQNGYEWADGSKIKGAGNSTQPLSYEALDNRPLKGTSYYRVKQTDLDGRYSYSPVKDVYIIGNAVVTIFPNPARDQLTVVTGKDNPVDIYLYSSIGERLQVPATTETYQTLLNTAGLSAGLYFLVIEKDYQIIKKEKIIIQK